MIYFIKQYRNKPIRIGITADIEERIQKLQAGSSKKLVCLKVIHVEDDQRAKQIIHTFFRNLRVEKSSWFTRTRVMQIFLNSLEDKEFYRTSDIIYQLSTAKASVNRFKIKIDVDQIKQKTDILKYNQSDLAEKVGLTRQGVSFLFIKQQASLFTVQKIATALKCDIQKIIIDAPKH